MPKFKVYVRVDAYYVREVEAASFAEAHYEGHSSAEFEPPDWEMTSGSIEVEEVEEVP